MSPLLIVLWTIVSGAFILGMFVVGTWFMEKAKSRNQMNQAIKSKIVGNFVNQNIDLGTSVQSSAVKPKGPAPPLSSNKNFVLTRPKVNNNLNNAGSDSNPKPFIDLKSPRGFVVPSKAGWAPEVTSNPALFPADGEISSAQPASTPRRSLMPGEEKLPSRYIPRFAEQAAYTPLRSNPPSSVIDSDNVGRSFVDAENIQNFNSAVAIEMDAFSPISSAPKRTYSEQDDEAAASLKKRAKPNVDPVSASKLNAANAPTKSIKEKLESLEKALKTYVPIESQKRSLESAASDGAETQMKSSESKRHATESAKNDSGVPSKKGQDQTNDVATVEKSSSSTLLTSSVDMRPERSKGSFLTTTLAEPIPKTGDSEDGKETRHVSGASSFDNNSSSKTSESASTVATPSSPSRGILLTPSENKSKGVQDSAADTSVQKPSFSFGAPASVSKPASFAEPKKSDSATSLPVFGFGNTSTSKESESAPSAEPANPQKFSFGTKPKESISNPATSDAIPTPNVPGTSFGFGTGSQPLTSTGANVSSNSTAPVAVSTSNLSASAPSAPSAVFSFGASGSSAPTLFGAPKLSESSSTSGASSSGANSIASAVGVSPAQSSGAATQVAPAATATVPTVSVPSAFQFGSPSSVTTPAVASALQPDSSAAKPFTFGSPASASTSNMVQPSTGFTFGAPATTSDAPKSSNSAPFSFGGSGPATADKAPVASEAVKEKPTFTFGKPSEPAAGAAAAPASTPFQFGSSAAAATAPPSFGSSTAPSVSEKPAFTFGASSTNTPATAATATPASSAFVFGASTSSAPAVTASAAPATASAAASNPFGSSSAPFGGAAAPASAFGTATPAPSFGTTPAATTPFTFGGGGSTVPAFGASGSSSAAPVFGASTSAAPASSAPFQFGAAAAPSTPAFPATANSAAATNTFGGFGSTTPATNTFGSAPAFGSSTPATSFGGSSNAFGAPAPSTSTFGSSTFGGASAFGATKPASGGFASPSGTNAFGATTPAFGASAFGAAPSTPANAFGASTFGAAAPGGFSFGASSASSTPAPFGQAAPGGGFTFGGAAGFGSPSFGTSSVGDEEVNFSTGGDSKRKTVRARRKGK